MISVIVPIYNRAKFLKKCLNSIKVQTFSDFEVILVDDHSTDNSLEICKKFAKEDTRFQVYTTKTNSGVSVVRNLGLQYAKKPLITFIDSDDWIDEEMFEVLYGLMTKRKADVVCCGYFIEEKEPISVWNSGSAFIWTKQEAMSKLLIGKEMRDFSWGKLYKKTLFENVTFPVGHLYLEDTRTAYKVFENANTIVKYEKSLYHYRQHDLNESSAENKTVEKALHFYMAVRELYDFLKQNKQKIANFEYTKIEVQKRIYRSQKQMIKWYSVFSKEYKTLQKETNSDYKYIVSEMNVFKLGFVRYLGVLITLHVPFVFSVFLWLKGKKQKI